MAEVTKVTRTAMGIALQAAKLLNKPHPYLPNTTLNEALKILETAHLELTNSPNIGYWCIGSGGHRQLANEHNIPYSDSVPHETTHTGMYKQVPFVLRQINDDLTAEQRKRYALRRKETHNGIEYVAYYLRRFSNIADTIEVIQDTTKDGITTSKPFVFTASELHPTPPEVLHEGVEVSSSDIIRISAKVSIELTASDVEEFINVSKILYGDARLAIISEIGVVAGVDKNISVDGERGQSISMMECIGTQVITYISTYFPAVYFNQGYVFEFQIGEGEPLLTRGDVRTTRYSNDLKPTMDNRHLAGTEYDPTTNPQR